MKGIITLCGSTRFREQFNEVNLKLTLHDWIVLTVGAFLHSDADLRAKGIIDDEAKVKLDRLHKEKIALAQGIVVVNVGGYIGVSTKSEIECARRLGKKVYWFDPEAQIQTKRDRADAEFRQNATTYTYLYDFNSGDSSWENLLEEGN